MLIGVDGFWRWRYESPRSPVDEQQNKMADGGGFSQALAEVIFNVSDFSTGP